MPDRVFTLRIPVEADYRRLATELVSRYFDLIGAAETDRRALAAEFARALERVAAESLGSAEGVEVRCTGGPAGGELRVQCGSRSAVVPYPGARAAR